MLEKYESVFSTIGFMLHLGHYDFKMRLMHVVSRVGGASVHDVSEANVHFVYTSAIVMLIVYESFSSQAPEIPESYNCRTFPQFRSSDGEKSEPHESLIFCLTV